MKKTNEILKKLAQEAKRRLKEHCYQNKEQNCRVKNGIKMENNLWLIANQEFRKPEITIKIINDYDANENFRKKVYSLMEENKDTISPLKKLISQKELENMTDLEREKCILNVADKYASIRNEYLNNYHYIS